MTRPRRYLIALSLRELQIVIDGISADYDHHMMPNNLDDPRWAIIKDLEERLEDEKAQIVKRQHE